MATSIPGERLGTRPIQRGAALDRLVLASLGAGLVLATLTAVQPMLAAAAAVGILATVWMAGTPARGVYLLLFALPLAVGLNRGTIIPILRPHEALTILVTAIVAVWLIRRPAALRPLAMGPVDYAFLGLLVTGSVLPLAVVMFRGTPPSIQDVFLLLSIPKLYLLYRLVHAAVMGERALILTARLMIGASVIVALIGLLQILRLFNVPELLATYFSAPQIRESLLVRRATSTLGVWQALAGYLALHAALAITLLPTTAGRGPWRAALIGAALVDIAGALATATLTGVVGLLIAMIGAAYAIGQLRRFALAAIPVALLAGIAAWPLVEERIAYQFTSWGADGIIPVTWQYRLSNLVTVFWPIVQDNLLLGVGPSISEDLAWRYPENQLMLLLYQGGIPYGIAYLVFGVVALRACLRAARATAGTARAIGQAAFLGWLLVYILGLFDPHLTLAGEAEAVWALTALAIGAAGDRLAGSPPSKTLTPEQEHC
ncbi:MAG: hypothetical protein U0821_13990 [Chloroflexota bacterium]